MTASRTIPIVTEAPSLRSALRGLLRRDVLTICLVVFTADVVGGILWPTFSLYAQGLGASLSFIGALSSITGLTQLVTSMPIGVLSDKHGRKRVLMLGMLAFALATATFALAPNAYFLIPGRVLFGVAGVATFFIGAAYVGDIVTYHERGLAFGLYATAMGLGFGVGPLLGAAVTVSYGVPASYLFASALSLGGAALALWGLRELRLSQGVTNARSLSLLRDGVTQMMRDPHLMAASLCNLLISTTFGGAISNFFPIYAAQLHVSQPTINSMFSARAFGSTLARLPAGAISQRLPSRAIMLSALLVAMTAIFSMAQTDLVWLLGVLLVMEGVAFGMFLPPGQAFIAEHSTPATRGQVIGVYSTAGSLGGALSPLLLGLVADAWSTRAVFLVTAALVAAGLLATAYLFTRREVVSSSHVERP